MRAGPRRAFARRATKRACAGAVAFVTVAAGLVALSPASGAASTPVFRQQASAAPASGQTVNVTYAAAESAADTNVVMVGWRDATSTVTSVMDSAGNRYQIAAATARGTAVSQA